MFFSLFFRFVLLSNRTLQIRSPTEADLGNYKCQIRTGIDEVVLIARLSMRPNEEWILILIIIIICVLILLILIMCIICVRKRARRKGRYGVKDVSDGKNKNRWDFQNFISLQFLLMRFPLMWIFSCWRVRGGVIWLFVEDVSDGKH